MPETVAAAICSRMLRLSSTCQEVLSVCSLMGGTFDVHLVASIVINKREGIERAEMFNIMPKQLQLLLRSGFVDDCGPDGLWRFSHDLYQQEAYDLVRDEGERRSLHWRIGAMLLSSANTGERTFLSAVDHLNLGAGEIDDESELLSLAKLNQRLASRPRGKVPF